jgi:hypothetical protein
LFSQVVSCFVAFSVANSWQNFPARPAAVPMINFYFFDGIGDKEEKLSVSM